MSEQLPLPAPTVFRWQIAFRNTVEELNGVQQPVQTVWVETDFFEPIRIARYALKDLDLVSDRLKPTFTTPGLFLFVSEAVQSMLLLAGIIGKPDQDQKRIIENHGKRVVRILKKMLSDRRGPGPSPKVTDQEIMDAFSSFSEPPTNEELAEKVGLSVRRLQRRRNKKRRRKG